MPSWLRASPWPARLLCVAAILIIALALRLYGLDRQGLWNDEALTITISNWSYKVLLLYPVDPTPGLYYMLHKALIPADASLVASRSIALVAGIAALPLIYALGRTLFGGRVGWIAAGLLAVWPHHVMHSRDDRAYTLLFALTLCASLGVALYAKAWLSKPEGDRARRIGALVLYAFGAVLSFYTHMTAVFWIAGTAVVLVLTAVLSRRREAWIEVIACGAVMALLAAPGLFRLAIEMTTPDSFNWLRQATPQEFVVTVLKVLLPRPAYWSLLGGDIPRLVIVVPLAILTLLALRRVPRRFQLDAVAPALLVLGYLAVPVAIWGFGFVSTPILIDRTILYAAPGAILLIALVLDRSGPRIGFVAAIAAIAMWGGSSALKPATPHENWLGAEQVVAKNAKPGDVVIVCPIWEYPAFRAAALHSIDVRVVSIFYSGALIEIEPHLGADPHWARTYHQRLDVVDGEKRLGRKLEATPVLPPPTPVPLTPGSTLWEVSNTCRPYDQAMQDAALPATGLGPRSLVWQDTHGSASHRLSVYRRTVVAPGVIAAQIDTSKLPN